MLRSFEARDRNLAELNYSRVGWLSWLIVLTMIGVAILQAFLIKSLFETGNKKTIWTESMRICNKIYYSLFWWCSEVTLKLKHQRFQWTVKCSLPKIYLVMKLATKEKAPINKRRRKISLFHLHGTTNDVCVSFLNKSRLHFQWNAQMRRRTSQQRVWHFQLVHSDRM